MSYNPVVHGPKQTTNRQRQIDPRAGKRRSDRVRAQGVLGVNVGDISKREPTPHGWKISYTTADDEFEVFYEYFCTENGTGVLKNDKSARVIRILNGTLFVLTKGEIHEYHMGDTVLIKAGQEHELTSGRGTDVELFVCQGPKFEENLEQIRDPEMTSQKMTSVMPAQKSDLPQRERGHRASETTRRNAEAMQAERVARSKSPVRKSKADPAPPPPTGAQAEGVNLRPLGAAADRSQFEQPTGIPLKAEAETPSANEE